MNYSFTKMQGCGNDFLILDEIDMPSPQLLDRATVIALCDRHFGIGADGLVVLRSGEETDAQWFFFNSDGSEAEMCGNAARCVIRYLSDKRFPDHEIISIKTKAGNIFGQRLDGDDVEVTMIVPEDVTSSFEEKIIDFKDQALRIFRINTGVPHAVMEVESLQQYPVSEVGEFLVRHPAFGPAGTNVTFLKRVMGHEILSTTFERGVEKETYACGTGVVAAALVYSELYAQALPIRVIVPGGALEVDLSPQSHKTLLRGPTTYIMEAEWTGSPRNYKSPVLYGDRKQDIEV